MILHYIKMKEWHGKENKYKILKGFELPYHTLSDSECRDCGKIKEFDMIYEKVKIFFD